MTRSERLWAALKAATAIADTARVFFEHCDDATGHYFECPWCDARNDCDCTERDDGWPGVGDRLTRIGLSIVHQDCPMHALIEALEMQW